MGNQWENTSKPQGSFGRRVTRGRLHFIYYTYQGTRKRILQKGSNPTALSNDNYNKEHRTSNKTPSQGGSSSSLGDADNVAVLLFFCWFFFLEGVGGVIFVC